MHRDKLVEDFDHFDELAHQVSAPALPLQLGEEGVHPVIRELSLLRSLMPLNHLGLFQIGDFQGSRHD